LVGRRLLGATAMCHHGWGTTTMTMGCDGD
jgi:hypothetical protein